MDEDDVGPDPLGARVVEDLDLDGVVVVVPLGSQPNQTW